MLHKVSANEINNTHKVSTQSNNSKHMFLIQFPTHSSITISSHMSKIKIPDLKMLYSSKFGLYALCLSYCSWHFEAVGHPLRLRPVSERICDVPIGALIPRTDLHTWRLFATLPHQPPWERWGPEVQTATCPLSPALKDPTFLSQGHRTLYRQNQSKSDKNNKALLPITISLVEKQTIPKPTHSK